MPEYEVRFHPAAVQEAEVSQRENHDKKQDTILVLSVNLSDRLMRLSEGRYDPSS